MGQKKIVLDTNIFVSALGWKGGPEEILRKVVKGEYTLVISFEQLEEIKKVLAYPKFGFSQRQKERFMVLLYNIATTIKTKTTLRVIKEDVSDNVLLVAAEEAHVDCIVTGDKHLLKLKTHGKIRILTPAEFLRR